MRLNYYIAIGTVVVAALYMLATSQIPIPGFGGPVNAKVFPYLLGMGLIVGAVLLFLEQRRSVKKPITEPAAPADRAPARPVNPLLVPAIIVWMVVYVTFLDSLGYLISTSVFLSVLASYFHRRSIPVAVGSSIAFTLLMYFMFTRIFEIRLPSGILPF